MPIALPPLPYPYGALAPFMSSATLHFHHDGHQARYVRNTNEMVRGTDLENATLLEIVQEAQLRCIQEGERVPRPFGRPGASWEGLFRQSSQAWNHALFWHSMRPGGGRPPRGVLTRFFEEAREAFAGEAKDRFASGWVWLTVHEGELRVVSTPNAERPLGQPLLVCDVWEHAYYLDYPDAKAQFVQTWLDRLVNWDFAEQMLAGEVPAELR